MKYSKWAQFIIGTSVLTTFIQCAFVKVCLKAKPSTYINQGFHHLWKRRKYRTNCMNEVACLLACQELLSFCKITFFSVSSRTSSFSHPSIRVKLIHFSFNYLPKTSIMGSNIPTVDPIFNNRKSSQMNISKALAALGFGGWNELESGK